MSEVTIYTLENEAEALREEGKYDEAIAKLNQALEMDENFVRAHLALAVLYDRVSKPELSVRHGEKAVELEPDDKFNHIALSVTYQRAFEHTKNTEYITRAEDAKARASGGM